MFLAATLLALCSASALLLALGLGVALEPGTGRDPGRRPGLV
ncbi:hypothetical protein [Methylobacterium sp. A54F]